MKRGRRVCGGIYTAQDGRKAFLAYRKTRDIARAKERSISDAIRKGVATWSIEVETLYKIRAKDIRFSGVMCRESGDIWLTTTDRFFDPTVSKPGEGFFGNTGPHRHLSLTEFRHKPGKCRL